MPSAFCPTCGIEIAAAALECPNCGAVLVALAAAEQPPPASPAPQTHSARPPARRWGPAFSGEKFSQRAARQHQILQQVREMQLAFMAHNPAAIFRLLESFKTPLGGWKRAGLPVETLEGIACAASELEQAHKALAQESSRPRPNLPLLGLLAGGLVLCALAAGLWAGLLMSPTRVQTQVLEATAPPVVPNVAVNGPESAPTLTPAPTLTSTPLPQMQALNFDNVTRVRDVFHWAAGGEITGLAFSPDGRLLASADSTETISVWPLWETQPLYQLPGLVAAFSPDGRWLAVAGRQGVSLYRPSDGALQRDIHLGRAYHSVAFSPDSQRLVAGANDSRFHVFLVNDASELVGGGIFSNPVHTLAFSADGRYLAVASNELTYVWNFQEQKIGRNLPVSKKMPLFFSATLDPDGEWFATGQDDGQMYIWRVRNGERMAAFNDKSRFVRGLAFLHFPNLPGQELLISGDEVNLSFWQMRGYETVLLRSVYVSSPVRSLALAADDTFLALGGKDGVIWLWGLLR